MRCIPDSKANDSGVRKQKFHGFRNPASSETQGQIKEARESLNGWKNIYEKHKFSGTNQKPERRRPFGTSLVRHCPQELFSPFFTFLRATFFRPFRLSLVPTFCPWVSEDGNPDALTWGERIHVMPLPRNKLFCCLTKHSKSS